MADGGIVPRFERAHGVSGHAFGAEPHEVAARGWELAATETIAAVGRERSAVVEARLRLSGVQLGASQVGARDVRVLVVGALRAVVGLRVEVRGDFVRIALVIPEAVVVAVAAVLVEVAIDVAARAGLTRDAAVETLLRVVAGA